MHRAVTFNTIETVGILLKKDKSDINALTAKNETAVFLALKRAGSKNIVRTLIEFGADLNLLNNDGMTTIEVLMELIL